MGLQTWLCTLKIMRNCGCPWSKMSQELDYFWAQEREAGGGTSIGCCHQCPRTTLLALSRTLACVYSTVWDEGNKTEKHPTALCSVFLTGFSKSVCMSQGVRAQKETGKKEMIAASETWCEPRPRNNESWQGDLKLWLEPWLRSKSSWPSWQSTGLWYRASSSQLRQLTMQLQGILFLFWSSQSPMHMCTCPDTDT